MLEKLFQLKAHNTTLRTEILAGITTFLTMAYILFVNPSILAETGMDHGAVFVATCGGSHRLGDHGAGRQLPDRAGTGHGPERLLHLHRGADHGLRQTALGAVFLSGLIFFGLSIFKIREWIIHSIPLALRAGIAAGIGLFRRSSP